MALSCATTPFFRCLAFLSCALIAAPALVIPSAAEAQSRHGFSGGGGGWAGRGWGGRGWAGPRGGFSPGRAVIPRGAFVRPVYGQSFAWRGGGSSVYRGGYAPSARPFYRQAVYPGLYRRPYAAYRYPAYRYRYPVYGYGYPGYGYGFPAYGYYGTYGDGGAAAGLIGGLALGMIAQAAIRPAYRQAYSTHCFYERRRVITRNGHAVIRRVRSCY